MVPGWANEAECRGVLSSIAGLNCREQAACRKQRCIHRFFRMDSVCIEAALEPPGLEDFFIMPALVAPQDFPLRCRPSSAPVQFSRESFRVFQGLEAAFQPGCPLRMSRARVVFKKNSIGVNRDIVGRVHVAGFMFDCNGAG